MAERRMLTKKVTDDDNFMSLSSSAQALYLHLSMSADDDGFCNQVSICMFKAHASVQDLQALLEKRYIYQFDNGVIVIKHWRMANALRKDRYTPTAFQEELAKLDVKENGSYTWLPDGCQTVAKRLPQDSIGKVNKGKVNNIESADAIDGFTSDEELKQLLREFVKMRKDMKKPMTDRAVTMLLNKLTELSKDVQTQKKILEQSIFRGWLSVFPLEQKRKQNQTSVYSTDASYDINDFTSRAIGLRPEDRKGDEEPVYTGTVEPDDDPWAAALKNAVGLRED